MPDGRKAGARWLRVDPGAEENGFVASLNSVATTRMSMRWMEFPTRKTIDPGALGHDRGRAQEQSRTRAGSLIARVHLNVNVFGR